MLVEMLGLVDAEDVEERGNNGHHRHSEDAANNQSEEHLGDYMQGMSRKGTVIQPPVAHYQQDACQNVSERKAVGPKERLQVECHQWQEEEERGEVGPAINPMEPERQRHQRHEKPENIAIDSALVLSGRFAIMVSL